MARARQTALIADDDEFFRMAISSVLLNKVGFSHVIEAASLDEAIERLSEAGSVALASFDLQMPGMESAASLRAVRECFPSTKVVMVSASQRRHDVLLTLEAGAHGYIPKRLGIVELTSALQVVAEGAIYVPTLMTDLRDATEEPSQRFQAWDLHPSQPEASLSPQQQRVLHCLVEGQSNKEIARSLKLSESTVKIHVAALFRVLGVNNRSAAAVVGVRLLGAASGDARGAASGAHAADNPRRPFVEAATQSAGGGTVVHLGVPTRPSYSYSTMRRGRSGLSMFRKSRSPG